MLLPNGSAKGSVELRHFQKSSSDLTPTTVWTPSGGIVAARLPLQVELVYTYSWPVPRLVTKSESPDPIDVMRNQCRAAAAEFDSIMTTPDPADAFLEIGTLRSALAAKLYCGQAGWQTATIGSEKFGGLGHTHDHPIGKLVRDIRYVNIVEGGEDVIRDLMYNRFAAPPMRRR
ncbi:acyl-CoA dehydrogenase family protein [Nocardia sp. NPDC051756]|uniref:acyl-CoA dehydrogenase family protein n=1 Tax=Nocardia sp. NPDC051756 TaxID=3154751 RepID=UPI003435ABC6